MTATQKCVYQVNVRIHGEYFSEHRHTDSIVVFTKPCTELKLFCESAEQFAKHSVSKQKSNVRFTSNLNLCYILHVANNM
jgi:hypothetical protein